MPWTRSASRIVQNIAKKQAAALAAWGAKKVATKAYNAIANRVPANGSNARFSKVATRKSKKTLSRKGKKQRKSKKKLVNLIRKVTEEPLPSGLYRRATSAYGDLSQVDQNIIYTDIGGNYLSVGGMGQIMNAASVLFNGKTDSANEVLETGDFVPGTNVWVTKCTAYYEFRNITQTPIEVKMDVYTCKTLTDDTPIVAWNLGYQNMNFSQTGTSTYKQPNPANDLFANPTESPNFNEKYTCKTVVFTLLPSECRRETVTARCGMYKPAKYVGGTSTNTAPVYYQSNPGQKYIAFRSRSLIGSGYNVASTPNHQPRFYQSTPANGCCVVTQVLDYGIKCPDDAPVQYRVKSVTHANWIADPFVNNLAITEHPFNNPAVTLNSV